MSYVPPFTIFMLQCLKQALTETAQSNQKSNQKTLLVIQKDPFVTIKELQEMTGLSGSGVKKNIRPLGEDGLIRRIGGNKGGHWEKISQS